MISVVLYGRPGCHLCEAARDLLLEFQPRHKFDLAEFNINEDEALFDKYCADIPVVTINGEYFCHYEVDYKALELKFESMEKEYKQ